MPLPNFISIKSPRNSALPVARNKSGTPGVTPSFFNLSPSSEEGNPRRDQGRLRRRPEFRRLGRLPPAGSDRDRGRPRRRPEGVHRRGKARLQHRGDEERRDLRSLPINLPTRESA